MRLRTLQWMLCAAVAFAGDWTQPVEVRHDEKKCLSYRARLSGEYVVVEAAVEPGWHTFAMDNRQRQEEKLKGKPSLGIERSTEIRLADGLEASGPWFQTPPKDLSKPEIRWYTWGFDQQAQFAAKVRRAGAGPARITMRGQACSDSICRNIDVALELPLSESAGGAADIDLKALTQVR